MSGACVYFPVPTRFWSRVQNNCTFVDSSDNNYYQSVIIPIPVIPSTQQPMTLAEANYQDKLIYKGNILQYKGNSAQLTKKQKYTQLAKGFGPGRTKVFATQTQTYTNPNTSGLQRVNYTTLPFPNTLVGQPNNISGPFQYAVPNPNGCLNVDGSPSTSLQDGGTLVCGTYADPCTGELIKANNSSAATCNPASASNVPGQSVLCWNKNIQTWFPRQRYIMNTSGTKWPQGYKGFASAVLFVPVLTASATCSQILLTWTSPPASAKTFVGYNIYVNNTLYASVPSQTTSYEFNEPVGSYSIYITYMVSHAIPSNTVNILIVPGGKVISSSNIKSTHYSSVPYGGDNYSGLVIETTDPPSTTGVSAGIATFTVCATVTNVSLLIVGGGGGGSSGFTTVSGGAGGGGGGVIAVTGLTSPTNTDITIQVGAGGAARTQVSGPGASAGYPGVASAVSIFGANLIAGGGGPGYGVGSTGPGGGSGGNATSTGSSGGTDNGYGGSGGGGAWASTVGANASKLGTGGTGFTSAGTNGTAGNTTGAGDGGSQAGSPVTVEILPITTVNVGGGGGGGGPAFGGKAGDGTGGVGNIASGGSGQFATNYGGGGGGGNKNFVGGSGGSGVVMIWYKL